MDIDLPWFDKPHAEKVARDLPAGEFFRDWILDGYLVIDDIIPEAQIDALNADLEGLFWLEKPIEGLQILDVRRSRHSPKENISHSEFIEFSKTQKEEILAQSEWRIHGFDRFNSTAAIIYANEKLAKFVSLIMGRPSFPMAAINFYRGSQQALHQDMAVFHIYPRNYLIGAWIACEDISPDSGPLVFYPGSHREPLWRGFPDYPQTNLRTMPYPETLERYTSYINNLASRYERKEFIAKKGQVLLWHGQLIHGGGKILNPSLSRKSMVIHYTPQGVNWHSKVTGPTNW